MVQLVAQTVLILSNCMIKKRIMQLIGYTHILLAALSLSYAQNAKIKVKLTDANVPNGTVICLKAFQNGSFFVIDSIRATNFNKDNLLLNIGDYVGTCELNLLGNTGLGSEFIANPLETNIAIKVSINDIKSSYIFVENSVENNLYKELQFVRSKYDKRLNQLIQAKRRLTPLQADYFRTYMQIDNQLDFLKDSINKECDKVTAAYPNLFVHQVTRTFVKVPTRIGHPNAKDYDTHDAFLHEHYFDFFDFNNPNLIHHYALNLLMEQYFSQYSSTKDKILYHSCDILMRKASVNTEIKNYIYNFLINYGITRNMEYMVTYMQDNYGGDCQLGVDFSKQNALKAINDTKIGSIAPDILLYDANNNPQSLKQFVGKNKYTVLIFWVSWCAHCQKELPKIASYQNEWAKNGIGIFTVSVDEQRELWLKALEKYNISGANVSELVPIKQSKILPAYNIYTTPALFILNQEGKILAKDVYGDKLVETLQNLPK